MREAEESGRRQRNESSGQKDEVFSQLMDMHQGTAEFMSMRSPMRLLLRSPRRPQRGKRQLPLKF